MMSRFIISFVCSMLFSFTAFADQELMVKLDPRENRTQTFNLGYVVVTFQFESAYANKAMVRMSIENTSQSASILIFNSTVNEKALKKYSTKIKFEKTYGGERGYRTVSGYANLKKKYEQINASYEYELPGIEVSTTGMAELTVPFYLANYYPLGFLCQEKYKIFQEDVIKFILEVRDWTETDPEYIELKQAVSDFKTSLVNVRFCKNGLHYPSLKGQQEPYQAIKDSLCAVVDSILDNQWWMSQDLPHKSYTKLRDELMAIDLDKLTYDCGKHKRIHKCSYCSLNSEQIYHHIDDIYQQLHTGRISKSAAVSGAKALYGCYKQNLSRRRDRFYGNKIEEYYSRIIRF